MKFLDYSNTVFPAVGGVIIPSFNLIPQGVNESQRIGSQAKIKRFTIRCKCSNEATNLVNSSCTWMVALVLDKQTNGATPSPGDIFEDIGSDGPLSFVKIENKDRFQILKRKVWTNNTIVMTSATAGAKITKYFQWSIPLDLLINFGGVTATITDIKSNNLLLVCSTDTATGTMACQWRTRFIDC